MEPCFHTVFSPSRIKTRGTQLVTCFSRFCDIRHGPSPFSIAGHGQWVSRFACCCCSPVRGCRVAMRAAGSNGSHGPLCPCGYRHSSGLRQRCQRRHTSAMPMPASLTTHRGQPQATVLMGSGSRTSGRWCQRSCLGGSGPPDGYLRGSGSRTSGLRPRYIGRWRGACSPRSRALPSPP